MSTEEPIGSAAEHIRAVTRRDREEQKQRLQTQGRSSVTPNIAHAIVLKNEDLFFVSESDGSVPLDGEHGCGLYYHDCRFLNGYDLTLGEAKLGVLAS